MKHFWGGKNLRGGKILGPEQILSWANFWVRYFWVNHFRLKYFGVNLFRGQVI